MVHSERLSHCLIRGSKTNMGMQNNLQEQSVVFVLAAAQKQLSKAWTEKLWYFILPVPMTGFNNVTVSVCLHIANALCAVISQMETLADTFDKHCATSKKWLGRCRALCLN